MGSEDKLNRVKSALLAMQRYSWEQGVAMQAFYEAGDYETVFAMAKESSNRSLEDGRCAVMGNEEAVTDPCAVGEALIFAARETGDKGLAESHARLLDWALYDAPRSSDGIVYHLVSKPEFWVDSLYMLPPYLAASGCFDEAMRQIRGYWKALYSPDAGLLSHMWDEGKKSFIRRNYWGVGNGWAMAALCRVIDLLPESRKHDRLELIGMAVNLITAVAGYIREDGLSHDVLDDKSTFPEANLPQMLSYSIYRGIRSGWLDQKWIALADRCRNTAQDKVDRYGFVQGVCGAPDFTSSGVAPEAQAFYILMETASDALKRDREM